MPPRRDLPSRNIVTSGLTAAGKTTHSLVLREKLGYRYVSGLGVLARLCGVESVAEPPVWTKVSDAIRRVRTDETDEQVERELARLSREESAQVFDAWALAWTSQESSLIRIWIESTLESRAMKAYISQGETPNRDLAECLEFVRAKDSADRSLFDRTFGFDLFEDHAQFDAILDNSRFIAAPTREAADAGIAAFAPIVSAVVAHCCGDLSEDDLAAVDAQSPFGRAVIRCARASSS